MKYPSLLTRLLAGLDRSIEFCAAVALFISLMCISLNVFYRYAVMGWLRIAAEQLEWFWVTHLFHGMQALIAPISMTADEIPGYLLVWLSFLGAYLATRHEKHIGFELWIHQLPPITLRWVRSLTDGLLMAYFIILGYFSAVMIAIDGNVDIETAAIPQGWFMLVLPIATILLAIGYWINLWKRWNP